jgi:hypothetical protein
MGGAERIHAGVSETIPTSFENPDPEYIVCVYESRKDKKVT